MIKNIKITIYALLILFAIICVGFSVVESDRVAVADSYVSVDYITATRLTGFDEEGRPQYENGVDYRTCFEGSDHPYAKNIEVGFALQNATYYTITCTADGQESQEEEPLQIVPVSGKVSYAVNGSGNYTVTCEAYSDEEIKLGEESVTVKSDSTVPTLPEAGQMTEWLKAGVEYVAEMDWTSCRDTLSGIYKIFYRVQYNDGTGLPLRELSTVPTDRSTVTLTKAGKIVMNVFDYAGNYSHVEYRYELFDGTGPMAPSVSVSPIPTLGKYSNMYTITLTYYPDSESGLASTQYYRMNGVTYEYEMGVGIVLSEQHNYSFSFFATDKVGNRSEYFNYEILSSSFDTKPPYFDPDTILTEIDLTNTAGVCRLTIVASDYQESGIKSVVLQGKDYIFSSEEKSGSTEYAVRFDCFDDEYSQQIVLTDNVGNESSYFLIVNYFNDGDINRMSKELFRLYQDTDFSKCSAQTKETIEKKYGAYNFLLNTPSNRKSDFTNAYQEITDLFKTVATEKYTIKSAPEYASAVVTFSVDQSDFTMDSFGNTVELVMNKESGDDKAFVTNAGFSEGFTDHFSLSVLLNGENLSSSLAKGIKVSMNCPAGYLDRGVKLFDSTTGQEIETAVVDNKLQFTIHGTTKCALVISGGKASTMYEETGSSGKINVLGRTWPLGAFIGVVLGVAAGAVILIVLALLLGKRRG